MNPPEKSLFSSFQTAISEAVHIEMAHLIRHLDESSLLAVLKGEQRLVLLRQTAGIINQKLNKNSGKGVEGEVEEVVSPK